VEQSRPLESPESFAPSFQRDGVTIYTGDCLESLKRLPSESVQMCVTSPPFWGLRDYGTAEWDGGDEDCDHYAAIEAAAREAVGTQGDANKINQQITAKMSLFKDCVCGATRIDKQLGLEKLHDCLGWATGSPCGECYVCHLVQVFRDVRRVLRVDGVLFLNLGDSYSAQLGQRKPTDKAGVKQETNTGANKIGSRCAGGLKPKDLCMIPARVAMALQADGWWLRNDNIWEKPNCMPASVTDRCTISHEYMFMFAKSQRYYFDSEAIREQAQDRGEPDTEKLTRCTRDLARQGELSRFNRGGGNSAGFGSKNGTRNKRTVWTIPTKPFKSAHFATFPPALIEPCIRAGTSEDGCCSRCGSPWKRVLEEKEPVEPIDYQGKHAETEPNASGRRMLANVRAAREAGADHDAPFPPKKTIGWEPTCKCENADIVPCVVLDPFLGSGTTAVVARNLGRHAIGCELNPEYVEMAKKRFTLTRLPGM